VTNLAPLLHKKMHRITLISKVGLNRRSQILKPYMTGGSGNFQEWEEGLYLVKKSNLHK